MDKYKLLYFQSAAHNLSFTKAAVDCNVVQGTVSKQVAALEEELNVKLFIRHSKSIELTLAGKKLYDNVKDYIEQYDKLENSLKKLNLLYDDTIQIGVGTFEHFITVDPISRFALENPNTEINLSTYTYKRMESNLRNHLLDVVFCCNTCLDQIKDVQKIKLWDKNWMIAAHKDSDFWKLEKLERGKLKGQNVISIFGDAYDPVFKHCNRDAFSVKSFSFTNAALSTITLLKANLGISILPSFFNGMYPDLRMEDSLIKPLTTGFSIGYHKKNPKIELIQRFLNHCSK